MNHYINLPRNAVRYSFKVFKATVDFKVAYVKIKIFTKKLQQNVLYKFCKEV